MTHHYLVVAPDPQDPQERDWFSYAVECPGVTGECRLWTPCPPGSDCDTGRLDAAYKRNPFQDQVLHGLRHRQINDRWTAETTHCFLVDHDGLGDAVAGYFSAGRHPIGWDVGDGTELEVRDLREDRPWVK